MKRVNWQRVWAKLDNWCSRRFAERSIPACHYIQRLVNAELRKKAKKGKAK